MSVDVSGKMIPLAIIAQIIALIFMAGRAMQRLDNVESDLNRIQGKIEKQTDNIDDVKIRIRAIENKVSEILTNQGKRFGQGDEILRGIK